MNKDPLEALFHSNDVIVVSDNQQDKTKQKPKKKNYSEDIIDLSTHVGIYKMMNAL
jgi:hypothetical protein